MQIVSFLICLCLSYFVCLITAPLFMKLLKKMRARQTILQYVESHKEKNGTPTMGGIIFLFSTCFVAMYFIWDFSSLGTIAVAITLCYAIVGLLDDYIKISRHQNEGLKGYQKIIGQLGIAIVVTVYCYTSESVGAQIYLPFTSKIVNLGWWYIPLCIILFVGTVNAVNLTDGLDGLVGKTSFVNFGVFAVVTYIMLLQAIDNGDTLEAVQLQSLEYFICAFLGGMLGFLWLNTYPAKVFMGDTGSLAIGGALASIAVFIKNPLLLTIVGIMYVVTCISVIVQVVYFKLTKKRVFLMAPLHHHFEKKGIKESKIVSCYTIITIVAGVITIISCLV